MKPPIPTLAARMRDALATEQQALEAVRGARRGIVGVLADARLLRLPFGVLAGAIVTATGNPAETARRRHRLAVRLRQRWWKSRRVAVVDVNSSPAHGAPPNPRAQSSAQEVIMTTNDDRDHDECLIRRKKTIIEEEYLPPRTDLDDADVGDTDAADLGDDEPGEGGK